MAEPLRTLIVDDEPLAVERLQIVCSKLETVDVVGTANEGEAALRLIDALDPDLVLLDITMPTLDGLGVAERLAKAENPPAVVFVTAHDNFAVEAFDLEAVDYVLKPIAPDRLGRAIERAMNQSRAERDYVRIYVADRSYLLLQTLTGLEKKLDPEKFIRIHRSMILRRDAISGLCHEGMGVWSVETAEGEMLRIGKTYLSDVKAIAKG